MGIERLEIDITKVKNFGGSSYIPTPPEIKATKLCINVQNKNKECFKYAVLSCLHYDDIKDNPKRPSKYIKWLDELNFRGIDFPVIIKRGFDSFEKQNPYKINVLIYENNNFHTLRLFNKEIDDKIINLLIITEKDENDQFEESGYAKYHYIWIRDLSRLLSKQINSHNGKNYICLRCFNYFKVESALKNVKKYVKI